MKISKGHIIVTLNYAGGIFAVSKLGFQIYCIVGALCWAITGAIFVRWSFKWQFLVSNKMDGNNYSMMGENQKFNNQNDQLNDNE